MPFTLRVQFAGLCLYVRHPNNNQLAILMPDCRRITADPRHADGTEGVPHVGYVRFDIANLVDGVPAGDDRTGPQYELVHRLDREVIDFGAGEEAPMTVELAIPDIGEVGPTLRLIDGLFTSSPPDALLARMVLQGGKLEAEGGNNPWTFSRLLSRRPKAHTGHFAGFATWEREISGTDVTINITKFNGADPVPFRLKPDRDGVVSVKIANLCSSNPLEWDELDTHTVIDEDLDFKWVYRLLEPKPESYSELLLGSTLPVPQLMLAAGAVVAGDEDCLGGQIRAAFRI